MSAKTAGLSLAELLVSLAIIGRVTAILLPVIVGRPHPSGKCAMSVELTSGRHGNP